MKYIKNLLLFVILCAPLISFGATAIKFNTWYDMYNKIDVCATQDNINNNPDTIMNMWVKEVLPRDDYSGPYLVCTFRINGQAVFTRNGSLISGFPQITEEIILKYAAYYHILHIDSVSFCVAQRVNYAPYTLMIEAMTPLHPAPAHN